jgi:multidrug efflux pump subunit AcrA (membrane-fusion protein)
MKRTVIITSAVVFFAIVALIVFNKVFSRKDTVNTFTEAKKGVFEITVSNAGELLAERSIDIMGPVLTQTSQEEGGNQQRGGQGGGRQGGGGMGGSRGGHGGDFHMVDFKITDIVTEGTVVKKGDYIAQLDKTTYDNTLKDALESLTTLQSNLELKILDTTMSLTSLRDEIRNQRYVVEEAAIDLEQSKYEPPATIRKEELKLNREQRALEQKLQSYKLRKIQITTEINNTKRNLNNQEMLVKNLESFLAQFTIAAPSDGMIIYKKDRLGNKRKAGSSINPFDNVIATLPDLTSMLSKVYVSEIEVSKVLPGQKVNITVDAFPEKSYTGSVISVGNIGEQLPNSDAKMFEVQIRVDGSDMTLRPAMTTWNKIILKTIDDAVYIPLECVQAGADSVPYVYKKNKTRQIVVLGDLNDKSAVVKEGLEPGTSVYLVPPEDAASFKLVGENLLSSIKESN